MAMQSITHYFLTIIVLYFSPSIFAIGDGDGQFSPHLPADTALPSTDSTFPFSYLLVFSIVVLLTFLVWYKGRVLRREINSRKSIQDKLADANNRYQILVDNLPLSIFWKDRTLKYITVNSTCARQFRRQTADIIGQADTDLFSTDIAEKLQSEDRQVLVSGAPVESTDQIMLGGRNQWIQTVRIPLIDANGNVEGILGIFRDVSTQKKSEDELLETQRFNESVLRSTLDMVYIYDTALDTVIYANFHLSELLGYQESEIKAMRSAFHDRLIHPDDISCMNDMLHRCNNLSEGTIESLEFRMHDVYGQWFWLHGRFTVFKQGHNGQAIQIIGTLHDITKRIAIENELKCAFDRAQRYLDIVETVIVALDRDGRITLVNRKGLQILGHEASELIGKNWFETCISSDDDSEMTLFFRAINSANIQQLEYHENRIRTAEGLTRIFAWHSTFLTEGNDRIRGVLSAGDDITNRREAEALLHLDKLCQNMLLTLNQLPDLTITRVMDYALDTALILTGSTIGYLYFYSEATEEFTLYSWSKNAMDSCNVTNPQTTYRLEKTGLWGEAVRQRQPIITNDYHADNPYKRGLPSGHNELERHMNLPLFENGAIVAVIGVANKTEPYTETDIRHLQLLMDGIWKIKKRIEIEEDVRRLNEELERKVELRTAEVKRAHEEFERFFKLTPDLLCIVNFSGIFIRCNQAWEQVLGHPLDKIIGQRFIDFVHPDDREFTEVQMEKAKTSDEIIDFSNRYRCSDGSYRWIEWRSNTVGDSIFAVARDITEKKKYEDSLIQAKEEADRANRAKSFFLANMSHEIRTPLNAVIGYSDLLSSMSTNMKEHGYIESIRLAGKNLLRLINDILDLSKIEADMMTIRYEAVDLETVLKEIEQIFAFTIHEKDLLFTIEMQQELPHLLKLDEVRLRQVMLNLVGNAVKFTDKGFITISITACQAAIDINRLNLVISVTDSGIGIQPDERRKIFEAFHQPKDQSPRFGGTGLGLAISKKLIEMMNGTITVESTPGNGSTFTIILNEVEVVPRTLNSAGREPLFSKGKPSASETVLIVEDVPSSLDIFHSLLREAGLTVCIARNDREALELAVQKQPACIIMDQGLPAPDGISVATQLKTNPLTASIPIIALSSPPVADTISLNKEKNLFTTLLQKPVLPHDLLLELQRHIAGTTTTRPEDCSISRFTVLDLPNPIRKKAQELLGAVKMDDIRLFSQEIIVYGTKNNLSSIEIVGKILAAHAENFDITGVRKILTDIVSFR